MKYHYLAPRRGKDFTAGLKWIKSLSGAKYDGSVWSVPATSLKEGAVDHWQGSVESTARWHHVEYLGAGDERSCAPQASAARINEQGPLTKEDFERGTARGWW